jgi:hypothetical protein
MTFGLLNTALLLGLAGLAIPIIIHLLHRRRFEVVDWGAMQFLQISETTRRRLLIEEIILMVLRMGLIGVLVMGLAAPFVVSAFLAKILHDRPSRDLVLVFDGSASMGLAGQGSPPQERAQAWGRSLLQELSPNDGMAVLLARKQVVALTDLTHDQAQIREQIDRLPPPNGSADLPEAIREALRILNEKSRSAERDIIVLSDGQKYGWADENTLFRWKLLVSLLQEGSAVPPRLWVINLDAGRPANPPNWTLSPIRTRRPVAHVHEDLQFRTDLVLFGQDSYEPPFAMRLEVDGREMSNRLHVPGKAPLTHGQVPLTFHHRFETPGSHLLSVIVEPDLPPEKRPPGYQMKDGLAADNRRDFAIEVLPPLPVLLVDEPEIPRGKSRRASDFLRDALAPAIDPTPEMQVRVASAKELDAAALGLDLPPGDSRKPRVLILTNVLRLSDGQQTAIREYLDSGGGLLVTLGAQVDEKFYNTLVARPDSGTERSNAWLPARLEQIVTAAPGRPHHPLTTGLTHPALERFRLDPSAWGRVEFQRWWKVQPAAQANTLARLTGNDPLLVEGPPGAGRVLLCTVPLGEGWETNFFGMPEFPVLIHEIVNYLAGVRGGDYGVRSPEYNLHPGQPLRFRLEGESWNALTLERPQEEPLPLVFDGPRRPGAHRAQLMQTPTSNVVSFSGTEAVGVYRLRTEDKKLYCYTGQSDLEESDLAPCTPEDWQKVQELIPMTYLTDQDARNSPLATELHTEELWWWLMLGVIGLLCAEVWMTRRVVRGR